MIVAEAVMGKPAELRQAKNEKCITAASLTNFRR